MRHLTRRRFLTITAAATAAMPSMSSAATASWRGAALGASATMRIDGLDTADATGLFAEVEAELSRLEDIFSLYRQGSEISRLNRDGHLDYPSADLLDVLSLCRSLHEASEGVFDPTVQPLWLALARGVADSEIARAQRVVGFDRLSFGAERVYFRRRDSLPAPAITLNGIAQGAITDRIADLLRRRGLKNALIDIGEIAALGHRPDGSPWRVGVAEPEGAVLKQVTLSDRAIATSSTHGTMLGALSGHIINPNSPGMATRSTVSVSADRAAIADGLSTALCLVPNPASRRLLSKFPGARLVL